MKRIIADKEVSALGLGCWPIGGEMYLAGEHDGYSRVDDAESIKAVHAAIDEGVNFFDTADVYGAGHSERILGQAVKGRRDKVVLATKFGFSFNEATKWIYGMEHTPGYIEKALDASLKRLDTDYIDLYQLHSYPANDEEINAISDELERLVSSGKIKSYGWSIDSADQASVFYGNRAHCMAMQFSMNAFLPASDMLSFTASNQMAAIIRSPLAMGMLSGKYSAATQLPRDDVRSSPFDWVQCFEDGKPKKEFLEKLDSIKELLSMNGRSLVQGALAYIWAKGDNTIPIPGFRTVEQAVENARAMQYGALSSQAAEEIDSILYARV